MTKFGKTIFLLGVLILLATTVVFIYRDQILHSFFKPTETSLEEGAKINEISESKEDATLIVADNLQIPWEIVFLPSGDMLVTERPGILKRIGKKGNTYAIDGVEHVGEGGLLGIALHPKFSENQWIYIYLTTNAGDGLKNRVERYQFNGDSLRDKTIIIDNIPGAAYHDGGRIAFSPDGYLYITTGDAGDSDLAQDVSSLAGKILRLNDDGTTPADNPFNNNAIYSYGHRNPQGLAWDDNGQLWATEHGRSGILSGFDEINLIEKGKNYGWPIIQGDETSIGMEAPIVHSGPDETWAPAGMTYFNGSLFFGGLRGESLYEAEILDGNNISLKTHFRQDFGRIRAVVLGPDNYLYLTTSNTDGHRDPNPNDDKIIRVSPSIF